jgi:hypothetical protein
MSLRRRFNAGALIISIRVAIAIITVIAITYGIGAANLVLGHRMAAVQTSSKVVRESTAPADDSTAYVGETSPSHTTPFPSTSSPQKPQLLGVLRQGILTYSIWNASDTVCEKFATRAEGVSHEKETWSLALVNTPSMVSPSGVTQGGDIRGCWHLAHIRQRRLPLSSSSGISTNMPDRDCMPTLPTSTMSICRRTMW